MARGIGAFIVMTALVLSITVLSGMGYYASMSAGADLDVSGQNQDVQQAADQLDGINYGEDRSNAILQGPLAAVVPFIEILQVLSAVLGNTSGVIQLLFGAPPVVADNIERLFRLAMLITIAFGIRGAVQ